MYQIGMVAAIPFIGPALDTWGRRAGMFISALIIAIGVIIQGTCVNTGSTSQFMGGRFLLGFGVAIIGSAGPCYTVEISHPAQRGIVTGLYNVFWPVGAMVASGAARGGLEYVGNTTWLIPVWLQVMFPSIVLIFSWFLPESPRWLYVHGKREEAKATLIKYHGHGNTESEWVKLQLAEYEEYLETDGSDKRWWDYRALFNTRASNYRLFCASFIMLFGQWAGNGVVSYFLSAFLDTAGIRGAVTQTNVQLGMTAIQIVFASAGATFVDKFGRRPMLIWVNVGCCVAWIGVVAASSVANITDTKDQAAIDAVNPSVSKAVLAMVYIFQIIYSFGWTPMQALYPVEVLSFEMRAKGMAFASGVFMNTAMLANQFGIPVAMEVIAWKTYIVFCCWCAVQAVLIYFFVPETKGRTVSFPIPCSFLVS
jgi:sugar porter (SP) family MFS transporter